MKFRTASKFRHANPKIAADKTKQWYFLEKQNSKKSLKNQIFISKKIGI